MKTVWIATVAIAASASAAVQSQSQIYKHVDASGHITYSNKPMKDAVVMELEPLTTIPGTPAGTLQERPAAAKPPPGPAAPAQPVAAAAAPAVARLTPVSGKLGASRPTLAAIEPQVQRRRDQERRRILEQELLQEEATLTAVRTALAQEQQNPELVAAVRAAQEAADPSPAQLAAFRERIDKASGRIRGLQASAAEHEKNIAALNRELGALQP